MSLVELLQEAANTKAVTYDENSISKKFDEAVVQLDGNDEIDKTNSSALKIRDAVLAVREDKENLFKRIDTSQTIAAGTPFERPKIGKSVVDLIGGTPMVKFFLAN